MEQAAVPCVTPEAFVARITRPERLRDAWRRVSAAHGGPGVDGLTVERFRLDSDKRIERIAAILRAGSYRPAALRRHVLPKPSGGFRVLGIPTVEDRVIQSSAAVALQDDFSSHFSDASFAYRPGLGLK